MNKQNNNNKNKMNKRKKSYKHINKHTHTDTQIGYKIFHLYNIYIISSVNFFLWYYQLAKGSTINSSKGGCVCVCMGVCL